VIATALELSVPVLIGVPEINLSPFREFASGFAREIEFAELASDQRLAAADRLRPAFRPADWAPMAVA
jgi:hypothetical protein